MKIRVNYKSGHKEEFSASEFSVTKRGVFVDIDWKSMGNKKPLWLNADGVESIWQLDDNDGISSEG